MRDIVIASGVRTAIGSFGGTLKMCLLLSWEGLSYKRFSAARRSVLTRSTSWSWAMCWQAGLGQNPARQAAIHGGISQYIPQQR